jgi:hypothetical protein
MFLGLLHDVKHERSSIEEEQTKTKIEDLFSFLNSSSVSVQSNSILFVAASFHYILFFLFRNTAPCNYMKVKNILFQFNNLSSRVSINVAFGSRNIPFRHQVIVESFSKQIKRMKGGCWDKTKV